MQLISPKTNGSSAVNGPSSGSINVSKPIEKWWKEAVIYQIYPSSFCDSNGDGVGDLLGITSKIPYLKDLGVDVVWLSPIYKSPQHDMGYDVSDYKSIHEPFGTLEDWEILRTTLHDAGIKIIMDLVVNHTSFEHAWFLESRSSLDNPKRSWYHWRAPRYDENNCRQPPNNWRSFFGDESAWEYDETTDEYYLRVFTKEQPDLNWENPEVREAVHDVVNFWLEKGIDGFRVDAINYICKADGFPDAKVVDPSSPYQPAMHLYMNVGNVHNYLRDLNDATMANYDVMTVGETPYVSSTQLALDYVHPSRRELQMIFPWEHMDVDRVPNAILAWRAWKLRELKSILADWQTLMAAHGGWNSLYMENHDQGRSITRFASDAPEYRATSGKLLALMLASLGGTLYVYQGQDIGMVNPAKWEIDDYPDVVSRTQYRIEKQRRAVETGSSDPPMDDVLNDIRIRGRDNARTPMPWNPRDPNAGFTTGTPWMKLNPDFGVCNVETAVQDPESVVNFWKKLFILRKEWKTLVYGGFEIFDLEHEEIFAFVRRLEGYPSAFTVLNFSGGDIEYHIPETIAEKCLEAKLRLGNYCKEGKALT
ncbi:hypothetical protein VE02_03987 [Pseudogymnoascus sp. 03VT05]|nr:hypothetical protein VE02_03987 [Pseudogymnoascus sp. 03VT05]